MEDVTYREAEPGGSLSEFVKSIWYVHNSSDKERQFSVLPDGYFDIVFTKSPRKEPVSSLIGLWTQEYLCIVPGDGELFGVSFRLLAVEYLLGVKIAQLFNSEAVLPEGFGGISGKDLSDFVSFDSKTRRVLLDMTPKEPIDSRKRELFRTLYMSNGAVKVANVANKVNWSSRQINRYFRNRFGISLKSYCNVLRFRASFDKLKEKRLFPEQAYADQSHFIKESKKYSGATPKQLADNEDDRFVQLSTLRRK